MDIFYIIFFVIFSLLLLIVIKQYSEGIAFLMALTISVIVLYYTSDYIRELFLELSKITNAVGAKEFSVVIKVIGISIVTQLTSDFCKDSGQNAVSNLVLMAGKISIILAAMPLVLKLMKMLSGLLS